MCGLSGCLTNFVTQHELGTFESLMTLSSLRGTDGSGLVALSTDKNKVPEIYRSEKSAAHLIQHEAKLESGYSLFMGHARQPTSGDMVGIAHTHPFVHGRIIGMHNGTLKKLFGETIPAKMNDSDILFRAFNEFGVEKTLSNTEGAYACVWLDTEEDTVNFVRNTERSLYFGYLKYAPETIFWSSEAGMLAFVFKRHFTQSSELKIGALPAHKWWSFKIKGHNKKSTVFRNKAITPHVEKRQALIPFTGHLLDTEDKDKETSNGNFVDFGTLYSYLLKGCSNCGEVSTYADYMAKDLAWTSAHEYVCAKCVSNHEELKKYEDQIGEKHVH